ncbi:MAG: putative nucleic-acid-binding protein containing a Zn-ribbon, partial [Actinomycetia bacterium]|nr:putative nucleic-acid-binding protein containing a Zn-ribbon [Actinomycetes bacterium]
TPDVVSGRGTVFSVTVNHHPWDGSTEPWAIALVEIEEQPDVRLTTNVVGIAPDDITIGLPVQVTFEDHDPVFVPLFEPRP